MSVIRDLSTVYNSNQLILNTSHAHAHAHPHPHPHIHQPTHTHTHMQPELIITLETENLIVREDAGTINVCLRKDKDTEGPFTVIVSTHETTTVDHADGTDN